MTETPEQAFARHVSAARTLLGAGADGYAEALKTGRMVKWERMMHSVIDLLACNVHPVAQPANTDSVHGSPSSESTRPDEQEAPGSSIGLGAEGEQ